MDGQYIQLGSANPTAKLKFFNLADGTPATVLFNAAGLTLSYCRDNGAQVAITLVTATLGTWVSGGFIKRANTVHELYLPTAAALAGAKFVTITAPTLPTGVAMEDVVIPMGVDDPSLASATAASVRTELLPDFDALPTALEIETILADNITAVPGAVVTAMRAETVLTAWGATAVPGGGYSQTFIERRNGTSIGTRTGFFNAANVCLGMTAVV